MIDLDDCNFFCAIEMCAYGEILNAEHVRSRKIVLLNRVTLDDGLYIQDLKENWFEVQSFYKGLVYKADMIIDPSGETRLADYGEFHLTSEVVGQNIFVSDALVEIISSLFIKNNDHSWKKRHRNALHVKKNLQPLRINLISLTMMLRNAPVQ